MLIASKLFALFYVAQETISDTNGLWREVIQVWANGPPPGPSQSPGNVSDALEHQSETTLGNWILLPCGWDFGVWLIPEAIQLIWVFWVFFLKKTQVVWWWWWCLVPFFVVVVSKAFSSHTGMPCIGNKMSWRKIWKKCQVTKAVMATDKQLTCFLQRIQLLCCSHPNRIGIHTQCLGRLKPPRSRPSNKN